MITILLGEPGTGKTTEARKMTEGKSSKWFSAKDLLEHTSDLAFMNMCENSEVLVVEEVISSDQVMELFRKIEIPQYLINLEEVILTSSELFPVELYELLTELFYTFKIISLDQQHNKILHCSDSE